MSIGYFSSIGGSGGMTSPFVINLNNPGNAIKGYMPQSVAGADKTYSEYEQIRFTLRDAWNTSYPDQLQQNNLSKPITTPFRAVTNSGDLLSRENYSCGGGCQSVQSRPNVKGIKQHLGSTQYNCLPSAIYSNLQLNNKIPAAACNVKYVYDSSDYTTYLKQKAVNKNYNDLSYGGNNYSGSQVASKAIRRY